jgi:hypothetical protein
MIFPLLGIPNHLQYLVHPMYGKGEHNIGDGDINISENIWQY